MIATSSEGASGRVPSGIPRLDIDPFAIEFFENPYPAQAALRDGAGGTSEQMERLCGGALRGSPRRSQRSPDVLLRPRRRPKRFF
jgi:hypothetical protein